jgi:uncharacterized protein YdbL (DUF1318 family)
MKHLILASMMMATISQGAFAQGVPADEEQTPDPADTYVPAKLDADATAIVAGMNRFGAALYAKVANEPGDLAISAASISRSSCPA